MQLRLCLNINIYIRMKSKLNNMTQWFKEIRHKKKLKEEVRFNITESPRIEHLYRTSSLGLVR